jgi:hypothetical protein
MRVVFLIAYKTGSSPAFVADLNVERHAYGVTFNPDHARRFVCPEDARHEMLLLGLPSDAWYVAERAIH